MMMVSIAVMWAMQSTALALLGLLAGRLLHHAPAIVRFRWYQAVLVAALVLPWIVPSDLVLVRPAIVVEQAVTSAMVTSVVDAPGGGTASNIPASRITLLILAVWLTGMVARLLWLGVGLARLRALRRSSRVLHDSVLDAARQRTGAEAACRVSARVERPMTWGLGTPTLLVPRRLRSLPASQREAIYVHELLHVARGDTRVVVLEEILRAVLWFQPAVWLVVARLRLAREEVVDQATVALTSARRPYLEALLWCADETRCWQRPLAAVVPFFTRHQLLTRVASLTAEGTMSSARLVFGLAAAGVIVSIGALTASSLVPLPSISGGYGVQVLDPMEPGPLERVAVLPTLDAPAPRRTLAVEPEWPAEARRMAGRFRVHIVVAGDGSVVEARLASPVTGSAFTTYADGTRISHEQEQLALRRAALEAVRQWQFEPPSVAPMLITAEVTVGEPPASTANADEWQRHLERARQSLEALAAETGAIRVGESVKAPRRIVHVPPVYPPIAQRANVQGVVVVEAIVEPSGDVSAVRVVRSIPLLDAAALDAVRRWKYEPSARRVVVTNPVHFTL
jgi:TonB family protein